MGIKSALLPKEPRRVLTIEGEVGLSVSPEGFDLNPRPTDWQTAARPTEQQSPYSGVHLYSGDRLLLRVLGLMCYGEKIDSHQLVGV